MQETQLVEFDFGEIRIRCYIIPRFGLRRRDVADGLQQALGVKLAHVFERGVFDVIQGLPWSVLVNDLRFVQANNSFRERVVVRIATDADGRHDARLREAFGVVNRQILAPSAVMDQRWVAGALR